jgi:hypothetical protein
MASFIQVVQPSSSSPDALRDVEVACGAMTDFSPIVPPKNGVTASGKNDREGTRVNAPRHMYNKDRIVVADRV